MCLLACPCSLREALTDFGQAIALDHASALSFNARGLLLERMGQSEAALADFNQAIALQGSNVAFLRNRGLCYRARGNYQHAVEDFDRWVGWVTRGVSMSLRAGNREVAAENLGYLQSLSKLLHCKVPCRPVSAAQLIAAKSVCRRWLSSWPDRQAAFAVIHGGWPSHSAAAF